MDKKENMAVKWTGLLVNLHHISISNAIACFNSKWHLLTK